MPVCLEPGCPVIVDNGRCQQHSRTKERYRGTASERGYTSQWSRFRSEDMPRALLQEGKVPACGVALAIGPQTTDSQCKAQGLFVTTDLHLDHEPPLQPHERRDPYKVLDPTRVQFLCASCHSRKTQREQQEGLV